MAMEATAPELDEIVQYRTDDAGDDSDAALLQQTKQDLLQEIQSLQQQRDALRSDMQQEMQSLNHQKQNLLLEVEELTEKQAEIEKKLCLSVSPLAQHKIKLNVGGRVFETTLDTLMNERPTFFSGMFSEQFYRQPDENGEYFVDPDTGHFSLILSHLRGIDIRPSIKKLSFQHRKRLKMDAGYYCIRSLEELLASLEHEIDMDTKPANISLFKSTVDDSIVISETKGLVNYNPVLGARGFASGVHEWSVRIDRYNYFTDQILLGVCNKSQMTQRSDDMEGYRLFWGADSLGSTWNLGKGKERIARNWYQGLIVHVTLDCDRGKLTVDDRTVNVPVHEELHPVFYLGETCACTWLPYGLEEEEATCAVAGSPFLAQCLRCIKMCIIRKGRK